MWGAFIRIAAGWAGTILLTSVLFGVINPYVLPELQNGSLLYRSLSGATTWMPLIVTMAALLALIARGLAERGAV